MTNVKFPSIKKKKKRRIKIWYLGKRPKFLMGLEKVTQKLMTKSDPLSQTEISS